MATTLLIVILLVAFTLIFSYRKLEKRIVQTTRKSTKSFVYPAVGVYIIILLLITIAVEVFEKNPTQIESVDHIESRLSALNAKIIDGKIDQIDPSIITEVRTHEVNGVLTVKKNPTAHWTTVYIQKTKQQDSIVKEVIIPPIEVYNSYNLSAYLQFDLPNWEQNEVHIFGGEPYAHTTFISYNDSFVLQQFTNRKRTSFLRGGWGMVHQMIIILQVPEHISIETNGANSIFYIPS